MKRHSHFKFIGSSLLGLAGVLVASGSAQAVDIGVPVLTWHAQPATTPPQVPTSAEAALSSRKDRGMTPRGAQGPIRTEEFGERTSKVDRDMVRDDLRMERYPMSSSVGIP